MILPASGFQRLGSATPVISNTPAGLRNIVNDFTYTVRAHGVVVASTVELELAMVRAREAAAIDTRRGRGTGHVLVDFWTRGEITDTVHVYDTPTGTLGGKASA